jgi:hypothetical protein
MYRDSVTLYFYVGLSMASGIYLTHIDNVTVTDGSTFKTSNFKVTTEKSKEKIKFCSLPSGYDYSFFVFKATVNTTQFNGCSLNITANFRLVNTNNLTTTAYTNKAFYNKCLVNSLNTSPTVENDLPNVFCGNSIDYNFMVSDKEKDSYTLSLKGESLGSSGSILGIVSNYTFFPSTGRVLGSLGNGVGRTTLTIQEKRNNNVLSETEYQFSTINGSTLPGGCTTNTMPQLNVQQNFVHYVKLEDTLQINLRSFDFFSNNKKTTISAINLPNGAIFTPTTNLDFQRANISWVAKNNLYRKEPYKIFLNVKDDGCSVNGNNTYVNYIQTQKLDTAKGEVYFDSIELCGMATFKARGLNPDSFNYDFLWLFPTGDSIIQKKGFWQAHKFDGDGTFQYALVTSSPQLAFPDTLIKTINITNLPKITLVSDTLVCPNKPHKFSVSLSHTTDSATIIWEDNHVANEYLVENPEERWYKVKVVEAAGCYATDSIFIRLLPTTIEPHQILDTQACAGNVIDLNNFLPFNPKDGGFWNSETPTTLPNQPGLVTYRYYFPNTCDFDSITLNLEVVDEIIDTSGLQAVYSLCKNNDIIALPKFTQRGVWSGTAMGAVVGDSLFDASKIFHGLYTLKYATPICNNTISLFFYIANYDEILVKNYKLDTLNRNTFNLEINLNDSGRLKIYNHINEEIYNSVGYKLVHNVEFTTPEDSGLYNYTAKIQRLNYGCVNNETIDLPLKVNSKGSNISTLTPSTITMYPNPVYKGSQLVINGLNQTQNYQIINANGKIIENGFAPMDGKIQINQPAGLYIIKIDTFIGRIIVLE